MTARFAQLGTVNLIVLIGLLSAVTFLLPQTADASASNKTDVFNIKNLQNLSIPSIEEVHNFLYGSNDSTEETSTAETVAIATTPAITPVAATIVVAPAAPKSPSNIPPKATVKVYMHEPEIREYICPKLGDKCNTFIAILKAENGSHECTRDNRGTNRNGTIDIGLTQINWSPTSPYSFEQLQDCKFNLDIAMKKYEARGFQPWAAYNSGRYLKHMPAVLAHAAHLESLSVSAVVTQ